MFNQSMIGKYIKLARAKAGMTQEQLALAIGAAGQSTVGNYERDENEPGIDVLRKIAEVTGTSVSFLVGEGTEPLRIASDVVAPYKVMLDRYALIQRFNVLASAGDGAENDHEEVTGSHAYRREWLEKHGLAASLCSVIEVDGESMQPTIKNGDVVLVNRGERKVRNGRVFAFRTEDGIRLKRLNKQLDGRVKVSSDNPDKTEYPDEWLTPETEVEIIGLVVHRAGGV